MEFCLGVGSRELEALGLQQPPAPRYPGLSTSYPRKSRQGRRESQGAGRRLLGQILQQLLAEAPFRRPPLSSPTSGSARPAAGLDHWPRLQTPLVYLLCARPVLGMGTLRVAGGSTANRQDRAWGQQGGDRQLHSPGQNFHRRES